MDLVVDCYRATGAFPSSETYGIVTQIRRAAASVPANIAEGQGRRSTGDFSRFLDIAYGSLMELETQLILANRLDYMDTRSTDELLMRTSEIGKMLNGLRTSLRARNTGTT
jgi:four helix bundle protein